MIDWFKGLRMIDSLRVGCHGVHGRLAIELRSEEDPSWGAKEVRRTTRTERTH